MTIVSVCLRTLKVSSRSVCSYIRSHVVDIAVAIRKTSVTAIWDSDRYSKSVSVDEFFEGLPLAFEAAIIIRGCGFCYSSGTLE